MRRGDMKGTVGDMDSMDLVDSSLRPWVKTSFLKR